jgi:hypothetical protein
MGQTQDLVRIFAKIWEDAKKDKYVYSPKDFKHAKEYLRMTGEELDQEMITERAKLYLKNDFYEKCGWNFSAFINNISSFVPSKWKCKWCLQYHSGNISQENHQEECAKNPKFNKISETTIDAVGGLIEKFHAFCPTCEGTKDNPIKCKDKFHEVECEKCGNKFLPQELKMHECNPRIRIGKNEADKIFEQITN